MRLVGSLNRISKMLLSSWRITCAMSEPRICADSRTKETRKRVDGGSEEYKATGSFAVEEPLLLRGLRARGNRVWHVKLVGMVVGYG